MTAQLTLELRNIHKRFGDTYANRSINLTVSSGEVLGLLGENGAGKSTLMNILYGRYSPDQGEILLSGQNIRMTTPRDSRQHGIGMVHQHFMLIKNHTVLENLALGQAGMPWLFPLKVIRDTLRRFSEEYGLTLNPDALVHTLSAGEQQRVEIIRVLMAGARILILDEPTSVLTPGETKELFIILKKLVSQGTAIIFISHKLDEIMEFTDRVVVLRQGAVIGSAETDKTTKAELARMMVGREVLLNISRPPTTATMEKTEVLTISRLQVMNDFGRSACDGLSFSVSNQEIFGVAGVAGNGQKELVEALFGLRRIQSGTIRMNGQETTRVSTREINDLSVAHIPEERLRFGTVPTLSLADNAVIKTYDRFTHNGFLDKSGIEARARNIISDYQVTTPSPAALIANLSGGNIQKFIIGRELCDNPALIIASHPTYGVDIGATEFIRQQLLIRKQQGAAVLLVSEDLDELLQLCDRIAVMFRGRFMDVFANGTVGAERIGLLMAGVA